MTYLRRLNKFDLQPSILSFAAIGILITNGFVLFVTWPIDSVAKLVLLVICAFVTLNLVKTYYRYKRRAKPQSSLVSVALMTALAISFTYALWSRARVMPCC